MPNIVVVFFCKAQWVCVDQRIALELYKKSVNIIPKITCQLLDREGLGGGGGVSIAEPRRGGRKRVSFTIILKDWFCFQWGWGSEFNLVTLMNSWNCTVCFWGWIYNFGCNVTTTWVNDRKKKNWEETHTHTHMHAHTHAFTHTNTHTHTHTHTQRTATTLIIQWPTCEKTRTSDDQVYEWKRTKYQ